MLLLTCCFLGTGVCLDHMHWSGCNAIWIQETFVFPRKSPRSKKFVLRPRSSKLLSKSTSIGWEIGIDIYTSIYKIDNN